MEFLGEVHVLFDAQVEQEGRLGSPAGPPAWLSICDTLATVTGDPLNVRDCFVHATHDGITVATDLGELAASMRSAGTPVAPCREGIAQLLMHGLIAVPTSAIEGVQTLGSGDTLTATTTTGSITTTVTNEFPWIPRLSREDQEPSTALLRRHIAEATASQLSTVDGEALLLLSSGKDSVALAIALADSGNHQVPCYTFVSGEKDTEHLYAADLCARLGLEHHAVVMPDDPEETRTAMTRFFEGATQPTADMSTIPSMVIAQQAGFDQAGLLDGSGNDLYMGWIGVGTDKVKGAMRVRSRSVATAIRRRLPLDSPLNYFTRSSLGVTLPQRLLRPHELERLLGVDATELDDRWYELSDYDHGGDILEWNAAVPVRFDESGRTTPKVKLVARAAGMAPLMPFLDAAVADYYFNLPEPYRYDRSAGTNKVLLRRMLAEAVGYDPAAVGAKWFAFDGQRFLLEHADWVRDEVLGCALWDRSIEPMFGEWMQALPKRPFLFHSLHALFIVSGWYNHSKHLSRAST